MSATPRPLAVVTGASAGIGLELARQFAENGYDLIIAAEDDRIHTRQQELAGVGEGGVGAAQVDLATAEGVEALWRDVVGTGQPVAAAALNAGIGQGGAFADQRLEDCLEIVDLNVRSTVHLAKYVVGNMVANRQGRLLFTSSIASTQPGAYQAVYNASKSFVQSFALALRQELSDTGVTVTSLMPGPTDTEFFERADMQDTTVGANPTDDPADVARMGFQALMNGDERVIAATLATKLQGRAGRFVPDSVKAKLHESMAKPRSSE